MLTNWIPRESLADLNDGFVVAIMLALAPLGLGVVGPHEAAHDAAFEVRAFMGRGTEDPVTGSLNASLAQWRIGAGLATVLPFSFHPELELVVDPSRLTNDHLAQIASAGGTSTAAEG